MRVTCHCVACAPGPAASGRNRRPCSSMPQCTSLDRLLQHSSHPAKASGHLTQRHAWRHLGIGRGGKVDSAGPAAGAEVSDQNHQRLGCWAAGSVFTLHLQAHAAALLGRPRRKGRGGGVDGGQAAKRPSAIWQGAIAARAACWIVGLCVMCSGKEKGRAAGSWEGSEEQGAVLFASGGSCGGGWWQQLSDCTACLLTGTSASWPPKLVCSPFRTPTRRSCQTASCPEHLPQPSG